MPVTVQWVAPAMVLVGLLAGCGGGPDLGPRFDHEHGQPVACLTHQPNPPGARYTDPRHRTTGETLALLHYYTVNGARSYCDGAGPTDTDRLWLELYVELGADRANVAALLD